MRAQIIGSLVMWSLAVPPQATALDSPPAGASTTFDLAAAAAELGPISALAAIRPAPIGADEKRRALLLLPAEGELRPTNQEAAKLSSLQPVVIQHERQDVFEAKVIDLPQAGIVLYARSIVLISRPALTLLSAAELQAVVAHEIGHEYFWSEFERLRGQRDRRGRHRLELQCDAVAVLTLLALGLDPATLISAVRKLTWFNQRFGVAADAAQYPSPGEREHAVRNVVKAAQRSLWQP